MTTKNQHNQSLIDSIPYIVIAIVISSLIQVTPELGDNVFISFIFGILLRVVVVFIIIAIIEVLTAFLKK